MNRLLANPEQGILVPNSAALTFGAGGLLWDSYLVESTGDARHPRLRSGEEEAIVEETNFLEATDADWECAGAASPRVRDSRPGASSRVLVTTRSTTLRTGPGRASRRLPQRRRRNPAPPHRQAGGPLGWSLVKLESDGAGRRGSSVAFEGAEPGRLQADLLLSTRRRPQSFRQSTAPVGPSGRAAPGGPLGRLNGGRSCSAQRAPIGPAPDSPTPCHRPRAIRSKSPPCRPNPRPMARMERACRVGTESEDGLHVGTFYRSEGAATSKSVRISIPCGRRPGRARRLTSSWTPPSQGGLLYQYYVVGSPTRGSPSGPSLSPRASLRERLIPSAPGHVSCAGASGLVPGILKTTQRFRSALRPADR